MKIKMSGQDSIFRAGGKNSRRQYDEIDIAIADALCTSESLHSTELKEATKNRLGWPVSFPTFSAHVKRMLSQLELIRKDTGERGKKSVSYSLTKCARKKRKLRIFRPSHIQSVAIEVYTKIFLSSIIYKTYAIQDLDSFISDLGESIDKLVPEIVRTLDRSNGVFVSGFVTLNKEIVPSFLPYNSSDKLRNRTGKRTCMKLFEK